MTDTHPISEAAKELNALLTAISELIRRENRKYLVVIVALIIASTVISVGTTTTILTTCFLGPKPPGICSAIPGYNESAENNEKLVREFRRLQNDVEENKKRIDELEKQNEQR